MNVMNEEKKENKEILEVIFNEGINRSLSFESKMINVVLDNFTEGEPIFTYTKKDNIFQVCIYSNLEFIDDSWSPNLDDYSVSIITEKYTVAFKHAKLKYLKNQVYNMMKEASVEKEILEDYKQMIKSIETKTTKE